MRVHMSGFALSYDLTGNAHEAVVLLPALGMRNEMWRLQSEHLHQAYTVVGCETGGNLSFESTRALSLADLASGVLSAMDAVGIARAHIIGLSMGGMIAQEVAISAPERVRSLVLASTVPSYPPAARQRLQERARQAEREGMEPLVTPTMERWFTEAFRQRSPEVVTWIGAVLRCADPTSYAIAARAASEVDTVSRLAGITAPTLVIATGGDSSVSADDLSRLVNGIPAASRHTIASAAHLVNVEAADEFSRLLLAFLTGQRGSAEEDDLDPISPW